MLPPLVKQFVYIGHAAHLHRSAIQATVTSVSFRNRADLSSWLSLGPRDQCVARMAPGTILSARFAPAKAIRSSLGVAVIGPRRSFKVFRWRVRKPKTRLSYQCRG